MKKKYKQLTRRKFNQLCPGLEGVEQAVVMRFVSGTGENISFRVHRVLERCFRSDGTSTVRRLVIKEVD